MIIGDYSLVGIGKSFRVGIFLSIINDPNIEIQISGQFRDSLANVTTADDHHAVRATLSL